MVARNHATRTIRNLSKQASQHAITVFSSNLNSFGDCPKLHAIPKHPCLVANYVDQFLLLSGQTHHLHVERYLSIARDTRLSGGRGAALGSKGKVALQSCKTIGLQGTRG